MQKKILLLIASVLFALILAELILRLIGFSFRTYPETIEFGSPDPVAIETDFKPDEDLFWVQKNYEDKLISALEQKPELVFMGCSCTDWGKYDQFFVELVEARQGSSPDYSNFAVAGWSSYQGLQQLKRDIVRIKPEIVTIFFGWNDHWIGFGIEDKEVPKTNSFLEEIRLVQLVKKSTMAAKAGNEKPNRVSPEDFEYNLAEMVRIARENNIIPVLLTAPSAHQKGNEPAYLGERWLRNLSDLIPLHKKYIAVVRKVAKEKNVILCDLAAEFEKIPIGRRRVELFTSDGIHPSPAGDRLIASYLHRCFVRNNLITPIVND